MPAEVRTAPLAMIDMGRRPGGRNPAKVDAIADAIRAGKTMPPVILVNPGAGQLQVADGYHRTLAAKHAGRTHVHAWVASHAYGYDHKAQHAGKRNMAPGEVAQVDGPGDLEPVDFGRPLPEQAFPGERYPTTTVTVNGANGSRQIDANYATSPQARALGFNALPDAGYDQGALLMAWPYDKALATLHNKGVRIPLHVSFYDADGQHVDSVHLDANQRTPVSARVPHKNALEMHPKRASELGIGPGSSISLDDEKNTSRNGSVQLGS